MSARGAEIELPAAAANEFRRPRPLLTDFLIQDLVIDQPLTDVGQS